MESDKKHKESVSKTGRIPYDEATLIIRDFKSRVRFKVNDRLTLRLKIIVAGSYRRKKETLKDIDLLVMYPRKYEKYKSDILKSIVLKESKAAAIKTLVPNSKMQGEVHSQYSAVLYNHPDIDFRLDLFLIPEVSYPFALFHYTGDRQFNIRTRAHVKRQGLLLNQYGLFNAHSGKKINTGVKSERDLFKYIGITYKSPKQRNE